MVLGLGSLNPVRVVKKAGSALNHARKDITKSVAAGALDLTSAALRPVGLEKYAAPVLGAGITYATAGLGAPIAATLGAATAAGVRPASEGRFNDAAKGAATGAALAGVGSVIAPAISGAVGGGVTGNIAGSAAAGGASAALTGGDIEQGLLGGGLGAGFNYGINGLLGTVPGSVGGIDDSNYDLGKTMDRLNFYYANNIAPQERMGPFSRGTTDKVLMALSGGLLGFGGAKLASGGSRPQTQDIPVGQAMQYPMQQFAMSPQVNQYTGDYSTYGERGSGDFRFYNGNFGLLG